MPLLDVKNVRKHFGGINALDECSLDLKEGEILGLIGPNGSGKTTLFNVLTGIHKADSGQVYYKQKRVDGLKPHEIARLGIGRTFQVVRVFRKMTLSENMITAGLHSPLRSDSKGREQRAIELLNYVGLADLKEQYAMNLSYGQMKLLEFAMVLMFDPQLILLDEPASGVNPVMIRKMMDYIEDLNSRAQKTFIVIEHNIRMIMNLCDRIVVLNAGKNIADGTPQEIKGNKAVVDAYLGGG
jgi:ABC-type branched-subunit amino acid transport system ATPase component